MKLHEVAWHWLQKWAKAISDFCCHICHSMLKKLCFGGYYEDIMRILSCDAFPLSNPCVGYEATPWVDRGLIAAGIPKSCSSWPCWAEAWWQHWAQDPNPVVLHWHRPFQRHLCFLHRTGTLGMEMMEMMEMDLPSGYVKNSYWKWPIEIVDLPIKNGGSFHSYVAVYQAG